MPVHNGGKTLRRSLDSLISQTFKGSTQLICVLNCCTDNSREVIDEFTESDAYQKGNMNLDILNSDEKGIVPALNKGILSARYSLIARQDADDLWYPEKLFKQALFMSANPGVGILGTQIRLVDQSGVPLSGIAKPNPCLDKDIKDALLRGHNPIAHPSVMFRKNILERSGMYDDLFPMAEDFWLWLKASKWHTFANLPDILVDYTSTHNPDYTPNSPLLASYCMTQVLNHFPKK